MKSTRLFAALFACGTPYALAASTHMQPSNTCIEYCADRQNMDARALCVKDCMTTSLERRMEKPEEPEEHELASGDVADDDDDEEELSKEAQEWAASNTEPNDEDASDSEDPEDEEEEEGVEGDEDEAEPRAHGVARIGFALNGAKVDSSCVSECKDEPDRDWCMEKCALLHAHLKGKKE
eukprot:comp44070_c0_seq1/m.47497 comp44070_c0_seq1/g.47497  ORF comp44070_c0_seq1/g.47497 comp44070_c0_seq1/m.47497 type:complete len:180 (-) comp44070_c0_seq1:617-1156(-)